MNTTQMLLRGSLGLKVPTEFSVDNYDYKRALADELQKMVGSRTLWEKNKYDLFALMSETLDEVLPQKVNEAIGMFAEVIQVPDGTRCEFRVMKGKQRGKQFVTVAAEAGQYEAFRLDRDRFDVYPIAVAGAMKTDFERYLEGLEDIAVGYEIIMDGMLDRLYEMIQGCLLKSWNMAGRPSANKVAVSAFDASALRKLCNTVAAYGAPVIYCSREFASEMANYLVANSTTKLSDQDMVDVRERGYIGKFFGTPVVVMPQSFTDETNSKLAMNPCFAYVIPAGREKLVKVCMEGEARFREKVGEDWGTTLEGYKKFGVAMVNTPNYWGIYYNAGIAAGGWSEFNETLNIQIP